MSETYNTCQHTRFTTSLAGDQYCSDCGLEDYLIATENENDLGEQDGDWEVEYYFDSVIVRTSVIANSQEQAYRYAQTKITEELGLRELPEPDETRIELLGIYT